MNTNSVARDLESFASDLVTVQKDELMAGKRLIAAGVRWGTPANAIWKVGQALVDAVAEQTGEPSRPLASLLSGQRDFILTMAARAVADCDVRRYEQPKEQAVAEVLDWLNGLPSVDRIAPSPADIAREAIARYQALRVARPPQLTYIESCKVCHQGDLELSEDGRIVCNGCGRRFDHVAAVREKAARIAGVRS